MSFPTTQAAFHRRSSFSSSFSTSRPSGTRPTLISEPSYASAYRAIHGPRLSLPYQSSYQRDYAAVDEYLRLKREKERQKDADDSQHRTATEGNTAKAADDEDEGEDVEVKYSSDVDEEELADDEAEDSSSPPHRLTEDRELAEELKASSTFLPASALSPPSPAPMEGDSERRRRAGSLSSGDSSPASSSSSESPPRALRSSHSDHQPRASVPSLPIRAWQLQRSQNAQVEEEHRAGDDIGRSVRSSSLSSSASSTPAGGSPVLSRRTVGDRDSDWRPSRRIVRSSGYVVDPITGRYTALPSDPVSEAASAASSAVSSAPASHGSSPHSPSPHTSTPESPVAFSARRMRPRIDPASIPFAAGLPSHRITLQSSYSPSPYTSAESSPRPSVDIEQGTGMATANGSVYHHPAKAKEDGRLSGRSRASDERVDRSTPQPDSQRLHAEEDEREAEHSRDEEKRRREEEQQSRSERREHRSHQRVAHSHRHQQQHGRPSSSSHSSRSQPLEDEEDQTERERVPALPAKRDLRDRHQPPPPSIARPLPPPPPAPTVIPRLPLPPVASSSRRSARDGLRALQEDPWDVHYGFDGLTPGAIERRNEEERRLYEAELKRIREDVTKTNRETRWMLQQRMHGWRNTGTGIA